MVAIPPQISSETLGHICECDKCDCDKCECNKCECDKCDKCENDGHILFKLYDSRYIIGILNIENVIPFHGIRRLYVHSTFYTWYIF